MYSCTGLKKNVLKALFGLVSRQLYCKQACKLPIMYLKNTILRSVGFKDWFCGLQYIPNLHENRSQNKLIGEKSVTQ